MNDKKRVNKHDLEKSKDKTINQNKKYVLNLDLESYNEYFQFFNKKLENKGLHAFLKSKFPIKDEENGVTITYEDYTNEYNVYDEEIFTNRYLSHATKLKIKLKIYFHNTKETVDHVFTIQNIPIMITPDVQQGEESDKTYSSINSYFVINGTKKIMIYQLVSIGGIYVKLKNDSLGNSILVIEIVSISGSRIMMKLNQRGTIQAYVNSSQKIFLPEFFNLFNNTNLLRYMKYYKNEDNINIFNKTKNSNVKYALLFGEATSFNLTNEGAYIKASREWIDNYLVTKWNNYEYCEDTQTAFIKYDDMSNNIIASKPKYNNFKKNKNIELVEGIVLTDVIKNKIKLIPDFNVTIVFICFHKSHNIIARSFMHYIDKNSVEIKEDIKQQENEFDKDKEESDEEESESNYNSYYDKVEEEFTEKEYNTSTSIEYTINDFIRTRINETLDIQYSKEELKFTEEDIIKLFIYFNKIALDKDYVQKDYDELTFKKVKRAKDFIENIIKLAIKRLESNTKYLIKYADGKNNIDDFLNSHHCSLTISSLFRNHPLVQFFDETNLLSKISHSRKCSTLNMNDPSKYHISIGREVKPTYFNKICPVATPEGSKVGLVNSFAINVSINKDGVILTPYFVVEKGKITDEVVMLSSHSETNKYIACFTRDFEAQETLMCRYNGEIVSVERDKVNYVDFNNYSLLSVSACLIPGIQHNDARRALMGANMQRQALPLLRREAPLVGTGVEGIIIENNQSVIICKKDNRKVIEATSNYVITVDADTDRDFMIHRVNRFSKTNMKTCDNMITNVRKDQILNKGDIIFYGSSIDGKNKEIAIGENVLVAILQWYGYGFEDAITVSRRLARDNYFTYLHMNSIEVKAKEIVEIKSKDQSSEGIIEKIKLDELNPKTKNLKYLDSRGIIKIGTKIGDNQEVKPGSIIVSRVIPIAGDVSLEDSVLAVIFSKEVSEYKDISYKATYEVSGTVVGIHYFNRHNNTQSSTYCDKLEVTEIDIQKRILKLFITKINNKDKYKYYKQLENAQTFEEVEELLKILCNIKELSTDLKNRLKEIKDIITNLNDKYKKIMKVSKCCNIDHNVVEYVRIITIEKRSISIGDKFAGKHGNKGVIAAIRNIEDMPFLSDGTPIDYIVSPDGIPKRLNVGQIIEMEAGMSSYLLHKKVKILLKAKKLKEAKEITKKYLEFKIHRDNNLDIDKAIEIMDNDKLIAVSLPVFNSISFDEIQALQKMIGFSDNGKYKLYCGIMGEVLNRDTYVGMKYIMALSHKAKNKLSVREVDGGYSKITGQPLPRGATFGGQRFGEMEVWAVESYGAAKLLEEIIGPKSDDTNAKTSMYCSIFLRTHKYTQHLCETVNVVIQYLQGAYIKLTFIKQITKELSKKSYK